MKVAARPTAVQIKALRAIRPPDRRPLRTVERRGRGVLSQPARSPRLRRESSRPNAPFRVQVPGASRSGQGEVVRERASFRDVRAKLAPLFSPLLPR